MKKQREPCQCSQPRSTAKMGLKAVSCFWCEIVTLASKKGKKKKEKEIIIVVGGKVSWDECTYYYCYCLGK